MASWIGSWMNGDAKPTNEEEKTDTVPVNQPTAEELRQKRLDRLAALEASTAASNADVASAPTPPPVQRPPPANQVKAITPAPIEHGNHGPSPQLSNAPDLTKRKSSTRRDPLHNALQQILGVTLTKSHAGSTFVYVATDSDTINSDNLSEVLYLRLLVDDPTYSSALEYLFAVYQRVRTESSGLNDADRLVVQSVQEQCINYSVTCLLEPEMFPSKVTPLEAFDALVRSPNASTSSYLEALAAGLEAQGGNAAVGRVGGPILQKLVSEVFLGSQSILALESWSSPIQTIGSLVRIKGFATVFTNIPGFLLTPPLNGRRLQDATALGILLRFSTDAPDPAIKDLFANITKRSRVDVNKSVESLRSKLSLLHNIVTDIFRSLLKGGAHSKTRTIQWLEQAMVVNVEGSKENPNPALVSTAGMLINLNVVLLRLCGPFLPPSTKHALIDATYWKCCSSPLFPQDTTKLVAPSSSSEQQQPAPPSAALASFNFITQCFFLTLRAVHIGPVATIGKYMRLLRQLSYMQNHMNDDPRGRAQFEMLAATKMIIDAKLLQPELLHDLVRFALLSANVTCRLCLSPNGNAVALAGLDLLPLVTPADALLVPSVPEHVVEDILSIVLFVARFAPDELKSFEFGDFLTMALIFLSSPQLIRSPHLRAKMSECLFEMCLPSHESEDRPTAAIPSAVAALVQSKLAQQHLAPCLLALYGDVEQTGFYEKLEHRYNIACLLKYLWKCPDHKAAFVMISQNQPAFVKFAHGLMNHINSLLTDALTNLPEIKSLQVGISRNIYIYICVLVGRKPKPAMAELERSSAGTKAKSTG
ncbi:hypothetical protein, variant [Aphanomyces astaci]|uniref:Ubiquitin conjugation factor E4 core domain-containing protein n=1 Tax=Aphanomyces astaci TaxID=112090 RepID=W4HCQ7_APHAT|nr:hypothetical protein, variant [Aphanomyces astaci]ETV89376.1 hypothetical protein, variant [Aphanomyces astaci]|eukprot:XP_009821776.1 hypothetical protein, variant [Aphanomyces astaci]